MLTASSHLLSLERVRNSWKDDALFGYQFLNGANPMLLRRSMSLPSRLVLPPEMEDLKTQLEKELQVLCFICSPITQPSFQSPSLCLILLFPFPHFLHQHLFNLHPPPSILQGFSTLALIFLGQITLFWEAVLCIVECLVASLATTH